MSIIGNNSVIETSGGGKTADTSNSSRTKKFVGQSGKVQAEYDKLSIGSNGPKSKSISFLEGDVAEMTVAYNGDAESSEPGDEDPPAMYELTMEEQELPLAAHPAFPKGWTNQWCLFQASPLEVRVRKMYSVRPDDPHSPEEPITALGEWVDLYNKGIETWKCYCPVVVVRQVYKSSNPTPVGIGKIGSPPKWSDLASAWLKTGDDMSIDSREGTVTRTQKWTGRGVWPELLYKDSLHGGNA